MSELPTVSILIPTLNAERYLDGCLNSIRRQDYPADLIQVILSDAGSTDRTLEIAGAYGADKILFNSRVTAEAAAPELHESADHELILKIDADNFLVGNDWLRRMVAPLAEDPRIFASEPLRWFYTRDDSALNRYFSLTGVNDPVSLFVGNYGRHSYLTNRWTEYPHTLEQADGYQIVGLVPGRVPTLGANGYLVRSELLKQQADTDYVFDIDAARALVERGHVRIAKVDVSIGHHFADSLPALGRKTLRRVTDFLYWRRLRTYPWLEQGRAGIVTFTLSTLLVIPLLIQIARGYRRVRDPAWLYHIPVCWVTLILYAWAVVSAPLARRPYSRRKWHH